MRWLFSLSVILALFGCSNSAPQLSRQPGFNPQLQAQQLYVVPFETVMVPEEVSAILFNRFIDRLNQHQTGSDVEFIILKQGLDQIDKAWLAQRDYLVGEVYAYVEDKGSTVTNIKARSRVRLFQPGQSSATLELTLPADTFYENDYATLTQARRQLTEDISTQLADQLLLALFGG